MRCISSSILEGMLESFAEYYSAELSQKVKRGRKESRIKGLYVGGRVPFGYTVEDKIVKINEKQALLKTSHKDIPFFIDTPFARIDSNHRASIVSEFFTKVKNQMFILSTDEEIVGEYKNMMRSKISDTFILQISNYGRTKIIANDYFGE